MHIIPVFYYIYIYILCVFICKSALCTCIRISHRSAIIVHTHLYTYIYLAVLFIQIIIITMAVLRLCLYIYIYCIYKSAHNIIHKTSTPLGGFTSVYLSVCLSVGPYLLPSVSLSPLHKHTFSMSVPPSERVRDFAWFGPSCIRVPCG